MIEVIEDVWPRDAGQAEERLRAATSRDERFTIAADVLGRRLGRRPPVDPEVARTWRSEENAIASHLPAVTLTEIAQKHLKVHLKFAGKRAE